MDAHDRGEATGTDDGGEQAARRRCASTTLLDRLAADGQRAALTFAGQGVDALDALAEVLAVEPALRQLVAPASAALARTARGQAFRWSGFAEHGCDPLGWIERPASRPEAGYLYSTVISQPVILLAQTARYTLAHRRGLADVFDRGGIAALTGHSQGVMAAVLAAEGPRGAIAPERLADACRYMLWQGLHMAQSAPDAGPDVGPEGPRWPMAAVAGLTLDRLVEFCDAEGRDQPPAERVHVTLHNGRTRFVLSGRPAALDRLRLRIERAVAAEAARRGGPRRLPPRVTWEWLRVGGPFHSPLMAAGREAMRETAAREGLRFDAAALRRPVLDPSTGARLDRVDDLTEALIETQFLRPVRWAAVARRLVSAHRADALLDFGPGDGVARLSRAALRGAGVPVVALATPAGEQALFTAGAAPDRPVCYADFAPRLAALPDGRLAVDNRYTRATGHSPIILPGMTPTTVDVPIVAAAANGGHTAELAGGGQVTAAILERRLAELAAALEPGVAATFNALYLDRYLWDLHLGAQGRVLDAARDGAPLCGVTISAGIPPLDEAVALLDRLHAAGLWLNALKPGTAEQVDRALRIAAARPERPLFVHLEGGKAGGHHSWEDLDDLLLATYDRIRRQPNAILCVGGGVGDEARCADLLTGAWSAAHGEPPMPVDAVFLGTVTMACAEATASPAVKAALVDAAGTDRWVESGAVDGRITSGRSGLDADIHYLDNAASRCGRLLDTVAGDAAAVAARRDEIIAALDATARPYFGDIERMTWLAALDRLVELMAIGRGGPYADGRWPDRSWRERVADFVRLAEARLTAFESTESLIDAGLAALDAPEALRARFAAAYPAAATTTVHPADARAFVGRICARPGKPVPFVPVIDADVRRWYKADSLWAAQDERFDAEQVLVIPGPAAVRGIWKADEPVCAILDRFEAATVDALRTAGEPPAPRRRRFGDVIDAGPATRLTRVARGGEPGWLDAFADAIGDGPLADALRARRAVFGRRVGPNPVRAICAARPGATLTLARGDGPDHLVWSDPHAGDTARIEAMPEGGARLTFETAPLADGAGAARYTLRLRPGPDAGPPIVLVDPVAARDALRGCYHEALFGAPVEPAPLFAEAEATVTLDPARVAAHARLSGHPAGPEAPACFAFSVAWGPLFRAVSCDALADGLMRLVHLDQSVEPLAGWPLRAGDVVDVRARVVDLEQTGGGLIVRADAEIARDGTPCARLASGFFIRGGVAPGGVRRHRQGPLRAAVTLADAAAAAFAAEAGVVEFNAPPRAGDTLHVDAEITELRPADGPATCAARGVVTRDGEPIGRVEITAATASVHPLDAWIAALGGPATDSPVETPPRTLATEAVHAPRAMDAFAEVGLDHNPIHRSPAFARLAGLGDPIVHGMWTAARLHAFVVRAVAAGRSARVLDTRVEFVAPVPLGAALTLTARRVATVRGRAIVDATATLDGAVVARLRATVRPPRTAYVFPGQGIQQQGMGMADYARSPAARAVWDRADAHTRRRLGFSILRIVRDNPRELIVDGERSTHPQGVLHLTRFTQPAMAVLAMAQMAALREAGVAVDDAITAGHSVGEYDALAAVVEVLPLESVVEIVHQRGCVMHRFVPRDTAGRSPYGMGVIRPHHAGMDHAAAEALVREVAEATGAFLQIVNFNVRGRQYAVTGERPALRALAAALDDRRRPGGKPPYVEVPGIDVPFHSAVLTGGVDAFRETLQSCLPPRIAPERLVGRYVPNLVARAFALDRAFVDLVGAVSGSPVIAAVLADFERYAADPPALARTLLVELLAYQFASPVRWIETQELMLAPRARGGLGVERIVEIGVGYQPTVANMLRATLADAARRAPGDAEALAAVEVLNFEADADRVLARDADPVEAPPPAPEPAPEAPAAAPAQPAASDSPPPPDSPVQIADALRTLLALQARVRPEQLDDGETLDALFEGVSSRRNQALLDLGAEFDPGTLDAAHDMPLARLAETLRGRAARYAHPGPYLRAAQDEALRASLGRAGFGRAEVAAHLGERFGLGPGLVGAALDVLALETRGGPSARGGALGALADAVAHSAADARALLDRVVDCLAARLGRPLPPRTTARGGGGAVDAAAVSALADRIAGPDGLLAGAARDLLGRLGLAEPPDAPPAVADDRLARIEAEHGAGYLELLAPRFDARRHLALTGPEVFARRDVARLYFDALNGRSPDLAALAGRLALFAGHAPVAETARWYATRLETIDGTDAIRECLDAIAAGRGGAPAPVHAIRPALIIDRHGAHATERPDPAAPDLPAFVDGLGDAVRCPARAALDATWRAAARAPMAFAGRTAVVSGASPGSIALEVVRHLLRGGARVVLTTTTDTRARRRAYRALFRAEAGPGAELHVVPCNMASMADVDAFADWLFAEVTEQAGAGVRVLKPAFSPDLVLPFGALGDAATMDRVGARSHAALRVLLTGVERLIGAIARHHLDRGLPAARCHVVLPLSPNHGAFGGDGLYAEAKAALEVILEKWHSERDAWGEAITLCGARIGWVRSTGLMDANDPVAARLEAETGVRTFSAAEMGFLLAGLCADAARRAAWTTPLRVELTGGFEGIADLRRTVGDIRAAIDAEVSHARRLARLRDAFAEATAPPAPRPVTVRRAPEWPAPMPSMPSLDATPWPDAPLDLRRMVVIVGRGEVGPCGSDRTRFELEVGDALSPASVLELAWTCGLVRWVDDARGGAWVDVATDSPVAEADLFDRYHDAVRARAGIRLVEPSTAGYDPEALPVHASVFLDRDFSFPVASEAEARAFAAADPERTRVAPAASGDGWTVTRRAGSEVKVLRHARLSARVAGLVPDGFDFTRYGIPVEMVERVDDVALFNLIATVDAFVSAGLEPEELLRHVHPARIANTQGAGIGGMASLRRLYQDHLLGVSRQGDVLQETLINVAAAYVVQGYVGSYGAMSHPVGACATAAVSLEEGLDKILAGKAEVVVAGGFDDIGPEGAVGFADMGATADTDAARAMGLSPDEISRANDVRRRGFVEAQGGGTALLARGDVALRLGLPVHGVLAWAGSFGDGIQTSIPAPGMGALAAAMGGMSSPLGEALQSFGLGADDIALVYKHDTSTTANDVNENALHHRIQQALGRTAGNPLFVVSQKTLTGHSKGGAAAWQLNGLCQALAEGIVPGNRNLDALDPAMGPYTHLGFTDEPLRPGPAAPMRAGLLTSLGFGHVSAVALVLHPSAFVAAIPEAERADWQARVAARQAWARRRQAAVLMGEVPHYQKRAHRRFAAADGTPAQAAEEARVLLDPTARLDPIRAVFVASSDMASEPSPPIGARR